VNSTRVCKYSGCRSTSALLGFIITHTQSFSGACLICDGRSSFSTDVLLSSASVVITAAAAAVGDDGVCTKTSQRCSCQCDQFTWKQINDIRDAVSKAASRLEKCLVVCVTVDHATSSSSSAAAAAAAADDDDDEAA